MDKIPQFMNRVCTHTEYIENDPESNNIINKVFPDIYIISLVEDANYLRLISTKHILKKIGANYLICYMRRPPKDVYEEYLEKYNTFAESDKVSRSWEKGYKCAKMSAPELGCLISHHWVLSKIKGSLKDFKTQNIFKKRSNMSLILEDDIMLIKDFELKLADTIEKNNGILTSGKLWLISSTDFNIKKRTIDYEKGVYIPDKDSLTQVYSTGAYAVDEKIADDLANFMRSLYRPADTYYLEIFKTLSVNEGYISYPPLIMTDISTSTIQSEDFNLSERFSICYPDQRVNDYDIFPIAYLENKPALLRINTLIKNKEDISLTSWPQDHKDAFDAFKTSSYDKNFFYDLFDEIIKYKHAEYESPKDLAVCLAFFNPANRTRLIQNLLYCWQSINKLGVSLYTIEMTYGDNEPITKSLPNSFHVKSNSFMFHKENLWNILEKKVPEMYTKLLFLDADIIFKDVTWLAQISKALDIYDSIQPFSKIELLDINFNIEDIFISYMKASLSTVNMVNNKIFNFAKPGYAIACRRSWLRAINGFHEMSIMGCGDFYMMSDMCKYNIDNSQSLLDEPYIKDYYEDKKKYIYKEEFKYSFLELTCQHLFHGSMRNRQYNSRHELTKHVKLDEIVKTDEGLLQFKNPEQWNNIILKYFTDRCDDNL